MNPLAKSETISAAAGTGKTTELTRRYLDLLGHVPATRLVAITFTRKAAAELLERVSLVLHAALGEESDRSDEAKRELKGDFGLYEGYVPKDRSVIRRALADLGDAPVGTIDGFVRKLLAEFALDACLPLPDGTRVLLDFPLGEGGPASGDLFREVARGIVAEPPEKCVDRVRRLLAHYDPGELAARIAVPLAEHASVPASFDEVYGAMSREIARSVRGGAAGLRDLLLEDLKLDPAAASSREEVIESVEKSVKGALKGLAAPVVDWLLAGPGTDPAPEVALFLAGRFPTKRTRDLFREVLLPEGSLVEGAETIGIRVGAGVRGAPLNAVVPLGDNLIKDAAGFVRTLQHKHALEQVREDVHELRRTVTSEARKRAALQGALGFDDLLDAAVDLCRRASEPGGPPLGKRFDALLVDEVQDSNARQIELYQALHQVIPDLRSVFVGDSRQSIYLFRGAEPSGLDAVARLAGATPTLLPENWRSNPRLVKAQHRLFGQALRNSTAEDLLGGFERIDEETLRAGRGEEKNNPGLGVRTAVTLVKGGGIAAVNEEALRLFADALKDVWKNQPEEPSKVPTAAVLAPTWSLAARACEILRARFDNRDRAFIDGGGRWVAGRVARDLRILLAAFLDRADQTAWLGLWKHPMVGLSDAALALVRQNEGVLAESEDRQAAPAKEWMHHLGWLLEARELTAPHAAADVFAFCRAREPLRRAAAGIGSLPTAEVLERLAAELHWREVLEAGPDRDALFHLDLALDWIRELDGTGASAGEVLAALGPEEQGVEAPSLELHRPAGHVSCTTVFQAKGRKWDHVCVLSPGVGPLGRRSESADDASRWARIGDVDLHLVPVKMDPEGGLGRKPDPVSRLASVISSRRKREEEIRLAYVAVTRAAESVFLGIPEVNARGVQKTLCKAWIGDVGDAVDEDGVIRIVEAGECDAPAVLSLGHAVVAGGGGGMIAPAADSTWRRQAPSRLHSSMVKNAARGMAVDLARKTLAREGGLVLGATEPLGRLDEDGYERLGEASLGSLVHGWMERWRFGRSDGLAAPTLKEAMRRIDEIWDLSTAPDGAREVLAQWLLEVTQSLAERRDSPLLNLVTKSEVGLHFELPLLGVANFGKDAELPFLLSGRADLLVEEPGGLWTVIDFKAGSSSPLPGDEPHTPERLAREAKLWEYGPQLEGYARALNRSFASMKGRESHRVHRCALWFVRTGASVIWEPLG